MFIRYFGFGKYQQYKMNHYIKARTNGINCQGGSKKLAMLQEMFPLYSSTDTEISEALEKHFDSLDPQHCRFLQQSCFKTPLASVAKVYNNFRETKASQISEPHISDYFHNSNFVSLEAVQKWLDQQSSYPSTANVEGIREQIAMALLNISEQFGYIPNLERFLLYYPRYLLKVQKFKSRFFEEVIEETSEVTYLSPKNCCFAGIIAAVEIGCPYMIARMTNMFLVRDGSPSWITDKKYPDQFKPLFSLFRKIAIAPWSLNENDLNFSKSAWGIEVYFDLITVGMFVMSMSTICLALGLVLDEPCQLIPLHQALTLKQQYDMLKYDKKQNRNQINEQVKQLVRSERYLTKQQVKQIEGRQVQPYMKQIGIKLSTHILYNQFYSCFDFLGGPKYLNISLKEKDNSFFHRYRDIIEKGVEEQRKSNRLQDTKFECFKSYCVQGSNMGLSIFGKSDHDMRIFTKMIQVMTYNLCGYHNECFDYKKNIKLNADLTMPLKFYVRLLSISPLYINSQVLQQINKSKQKGWVECFDLGYLAITVAESKAKLLMSSIQFQLFK